MLFRSAQVGKASLRLKMMDAQSRIAEAQGKLEQLEAASQKYARDKLEQTRRFLAAELAKAQTGLEKARRELVAAQAAGEKWASGKLDELKQKAAKAKSDLDAAIQAAMEKALGR